MLYPAKWKRITVGQSKVLKNRLFRFWGGHPVYTKKNVKKMANENYWHIFHFEKSKKNYPTFYAAHDTFYLSLFAFSISKNI